MTSGSEANAIAGVRENFKFIALEVTKLFDDTRRMLADPREEVMAKIVARDDYVDMPTEAGYEDGVSRQTRTNVLIGTTVGLAAVTAVLFVLADLGEEETQRVTASVAAGPDGGAVVMTGAF